MSSDPALGNISTRTRKQAYMGSMNKDAEEYGRAYSFLGQVGNTYQREPSPLSESVLLSNSLKTGAFPSEGRLMGPQK